MDEDTQVLARAATVAEGLRISLLADRVNLDPAFLARSLSDLGRRSEVWL